MTGPSMTGLARPTGIERLRAALSGPKKALVPYLTAGDPDLKTTGALLAAAARGGADILELGIPFTDPTADGPVLQRAAQRALQSPGVTLDTALETLSAFSRVHATPVILFGYYNPFFRYGHEALAAAAREAGACGVLCVDLPPEEAGSFRQALNAEGLALIPLITPVSTEPRIQLARSVCDAFGYYVTATGVTGLSLAGRETITDRVRAVREGLGHPLVVGFGVRTPADAARMAQGADGVVVGSALVQTAFEATDKPAAVESFVRGLKAAL